MTHKAVFFPCLVVSGNGRLRLLLGSQRCGQESQEEEHSQEAGQITTHYDHPFYSGNVQDWLDYTLAMTAPA
jgi:hypothetical protein